MEQKHAWIGKLFNFVLLGLAYAALGLCWLFHEVFGYGVEVLNSFIKQLKQQKETSNVIDVKAEGTSEERTV